MKFILVPLFLFANVYADAQRPRYLAIGTKCPDLELGRIINFSGNGTKISDFKGKAILLDFWATWCSPCVAAFPQMDSLQNKFKKSLQIMPVTNQDEKTVSALFTNLQKFRSLKPQPTVIEDSLLNAVFLHRTIPHYIWIDSSGVIRAITGRDEITFKNIEKLVKGEKLDLPEKKLDRADYDSKRPLFASRQFDAGDELLYHSLIVKYQQGLPDNGSYGGKNYISLPNHPIVALFQLAFGEFRRDFSGGRRIILEGVTTQMDSIRLGLVFTPEMKTIYKRLRPEITYSYELVVPDSTFSYKQMFQMMQQDLNRFFAAQGIQGRMEKRKTKALALERISVKDRIGSKGGRSIDVLTEFSLQIGNLPLSFFIEKFQSYIIWANRLPIVDNTGYKGNVDIEIMGELKSMDLVNKELEKYDLKFVEREVEMDMIVITKTNKK